jgi:hypothetical protein
MLRYYIPCLVNVKAKGNGEAEGGEQRGERRARSAENVEQTFRFLPDAPLYYPLAVKKERAPVIPKYNTGAFGGVIYSPALFRRENAAEP